MPADLKSNVHNGVQHEKSIGNVYFELVKNRCEVRDICL